MLWFDKKIKDDNLQKDKNVKSSGKVDIPKLIDQSLIL